MQVCTACGENRKPEEFDVRYGEPGRRRRTHCIYCRRVYQREYQRKNKKGVQYYHARKSRPAEFIFRSIRTGAHNRGVPFNLTVEDIVIPEFCPILGIKLTAPGSGQCEASPSVDRLVPALGYVKGNVSVISLKANRLKNNATADELEKIAAWMRSVKAS